MQFEKIEKYAQGAHKNIYQCVVGRFRFNSEILKDFWKLAKKGDIIKAFLVNVLFYDEIKNRYFMKESKSSQKLVVNVNTFEDLAYLGIPTLAMWNGQKPYNLDFNIDVSKPVRPWLLHSNSSFECLNQEDLHKDLMVFSHPGDSVNKINTLRNQLLQKEKMDGISFQELKDSIISAIQILAYKLADDCSQKCVALEKDVFFAYLDTSNFSVPAVGIGDVDFVQIFNLDDPDVAAVMPDLLFTTNRRAVDTYISELRRGI